MATWYDVGRGRYSTQQWMLTTTSSPAALAVVAWDRVRSTSTRSTDHGMSAGGVSPFSHQIAER